MKAREERRDAKMRARTFGIRAEYAALAWLMLRGWRVLARNYRTNNGEIDLIAARGSVVAFVEVKARPGLEEARTAITHEKRRRISKAAAHWLARNGWAMGYTLRGDAIFIAPRRLPEHAVDVFALELM